MKKILFIFLVLPTIGFGQTPKEEAYGAFQNLIGGRWTFESKWENGQTFKQEYVIEWGLDKHIVKTKTYGTINQETGEFGLRNEGVRAWDSKTGQVKLYEFDIYGGVIEGACPVIGKDIYYEYSYEVGGKLEKFRDAWKYVDKDKYLYSVNMKTAEGWKTLMSGDLLRK